MVSGETVSVTVSVQRESDEDEEDDNDNDNKDKKEDKLVGRVVCPRYYFEKQEAYWLVIGDSNSNALLSIKRITIGEKPTKVRMYLQSLFYDTLYIIHLR